MKKTRSPNTANPGLTVNVLCKDCKEKCKQAAHITIIKCQKIDSNRKKKK